MFDPRLAEQANEANTLREAVEDDKVQSFIRRRKQAYTAVFSGKASEADVEFVMLDLAHFCRAYTPTFHPTNPKIQDLLEGRREAYMRIMDFTRLSHDTLYVKYTDAQAKRG